MAILKIHKSKATSRKIEDYIKNPEKTDEKYYHAKNCDQNDFTSDFDLTRKTYNKALSDDNVKYTSITLSFDRSVSPEEVSEMTKEFIDHSKLSCYQVFSTVHTDKESHMHSHIVISNVAVKSDERYNVKEGNSFQMKQSELKKMKEQMNDICKEHGHYNSITEIGKTNKISRKEQELIHHQGKEKSWKQQLKNQIRDVSMVTTDYKEFQIYLKDNYGVQVEENEKGQYCYTPIDFEERNGKIKSVSESRLGKEYSREYLQGVFEHNNELLKEFDKKEQTSTKNPSENNLKALESKQTENKDINVLMEGKIKKLDEKIDTLYAEMPDSYEGQQEFYIYISELEEEKEQLEINRLEAIEGPMHPYVTKMDNEKYKINNSNTETSTPEPEREEGELEIGGF